MWLRNSFPMEVAHRFAHILLVLPVRFSRDVPFSGRLLSFVFFCLFCVYLRGWELDSLWRMAGGAKSAHKHRLAGGLYRRGAYKVIEVCTYYPSLHFFFIILELWSFGALTKGTLSYGLVCVEQIVDGWMDR
jgi:hypothetical protein